MTPSTSLMGFVRGFAATHERNGLGDEDVRARVLQNTCFGLRRDTRCSRLARGGEPFEAPRLRRASLGSFSRRPRPVSPAFRSLSGDGRPAPFERVHTALRSTSGELRTAPDDGAYDVVRRRPDRTQRARLSTASPSATAGGADP